MEQIAVKNFKAELVLETSFTPTSKPLGLFDNTMTLYVDKHNNKGFIEWEYENNDEDDGAEEIGLWFEGNKVTDYDGVFELPTEAIQLLVENGYDCEDVE